MRASSLVALYLRIPGKESRGDSKYLLRVNRHAHSTFHPIAVDVQVVGTLCPRGCGR